MRKTLAVLLVLAAIVATAGCCLPMHSLHHFDDAADSGEHHH